MQVITILFSLLVISTFSAAREIPPDENFLPRAAIASGKLIRGSPSPDGKWALFEVNFETTATGISLASIDRSRAINIIESRTQHQTDKEVPTFLTWQWNPTSTLIATHDSLDKHSKLHLYQLKGPGSVELELPDLLASACKKLNLRRESVTSSGQKPHRWLTPNTVQVSITLTAGGKKLSTSLSLTVGESGEIEIK